MLILAAPPVFAGVSASFLGNLSTDSFTQGTSTTDTADSRQWLGASLTATLDSKESFWVGWAFDQVGSVHSLGSATDTYSAQETGPIFTYLFGKGHVWNLSLAYNVLSNATYSQTGQQDKTWTGTSYYAAFGPELELFKNVQFGARIIYYSANYAKQTIGSAASGVSVSRSWVMPLITISYRHSE